MASVYPANQLIMAVYTSLPGSLVRSLVRFGQWHSPKYENGIVLAKSNLQISIRF